jgi:hypothetical protein
VFAHHGFVDPRTNITVNYSKSLSWVFATATRKIIYSSASLEILCHVVHSDSSRRPMDLSSWVPDYTSSESNIYLFSWVDVTFSGVFEGIEVDRAHPMFSVPNVEGCESLLVVDGFELDTIVNISPVIQWEEGISEMESEFFLKSKFSDQTFDRHWNIYKRTYEAWRAKKGFGFLLPLPTKLDRRGSVSTEHYIRKRGPDSLKTDLSTPSMSVHHSAKDKTSSVLSGRRVAWFKHYGMGIVPATAEVGDIVCNLKGTAWIFRSFTDASEDLDMGLTQAFVPYLLKKDRGRKEPSSETFSPSLLHVSFIGECLTDAFFHEFYHSQAMDYLRDYRVARAGAKKIFIIH